jgi:hypothetical protein
MNLLDNDFDQDEYDDEDSVFYQNFQIGDSQKVLKKNKKRTKSQ